MNDLMIWIAGVAFIGVLLLASHCLAMWLSDRRERRYWKRRTEPYQSQMPDTGYFGPVDPSEKSTVTFDQTTRDAMKELGFKPSDFGELRPTRRWE